MSKLFSALKVGDITLSNRIIMAPMTRCRADNDRAPNALMAKYYAQRASAGLIITEATSVSPMGVGYSKTPGIWTEKQIHGWKSVTHSVHAAGGKIFLQLWHVGRVSDPYYLNGLLPLAPSAIAVDGHVRLLRPKRAHVTPKAMSLDEIKITIDEFRQAAINAKIAGFDGVEIHAANGYLVDQFLQDSTNKRDDNYGGNLEKRCKFMLDVVDAVIDVWGCSRVGVHLSPRCDQHSMGDSDPMATFSHAMSQLNERNIGFIFLRASVGNDHLIKNLRQCFNGVLVVNEQLSYEVADSLVTDGVADAVAFGQLYIANPDLVVRLKNKFNLNTPNPETFFAGDSNGYVDYSLHQAQNIV